MDELITAAKAGDLAAILLLNMSDRRGYDIGECLHGDVLAWWHDWQRIIAEHRSIPPAEGAESR